MDDTKDFLKILIFSIKLHRRASRKYIKFSAMEYYHLGASEALASVVRIKILGTKKIKEYK